VAVEGVDNLRKAFEELGAMKSSEWKSTLRAAVSDSGKKVIAQATTNIAKISPGKAPFHKTYLGRVVGAGFASRNIKMKIKLDAAKGLARAYIGVVKEAFYALSFFELGVPSLGISKEPWLVPALESQQSSVVATTGEAILKRINAIAKKRSKMSPKGDGK
jgi:hypothetical protein